MKATTSELIKTVENYKKGAGDGTEFMDVCIIALRALNKLNEPTTIASAPKQPRANKKVLGLFGVIARFLAIVLFIPTTILYFLLFMIANPVQYILIGKHDIAGKFHKYIESVIKRNEL